MLLSSGFVNKGSRPCLRDHLVAKIGRFAACSPLKRLGSTGSQACENFLSDFSKEFWDPRAPRPVKFSLVISVRIWTENSLVISVRNLGPTGSQASQNFLSDFSKEFSRPVLRDFAKNTQSLAGPGFTSGRDGSAFRSGR